MQNLWSPWRSVYIERPEERGDPCFLCAAAAQEADSASNLVVARFPNTFVLLNRFPYNAGHLMVVPYLHAGSLTDLDEPAASELMSSIQASLRVMQAVLKPHGINVGANLGVHAGAGVPDHVHVHLVPRWQGDTNFMPTIAETKVASSALDDLWDTFRKAFLHG